MHAFSFQSQSEIIYNVIATFNVVQIYASIDGAREREGERKGKRKNMTQPTRLQPEQSTYCASHRTAADLGPITRRHGGSGTNQRSSPCHVAPCYSQARADIGRKDQQKAGDRH